MTQQLPEENKPKRRFNWIGFALRTLLVMVTVLVAGFFILVWYINSHEDEVKEKITRSINESTNADVEIESIEPALLHGFPEVTIELNNVVLRDSLYDTHKRTFLNAGKVYAALKLPALLDGLTEIKNIKITDADILVFTDSTGYNNLSALKGANKAAGVDEKVGNKLEIDRINFNNVRFVVEDLQKKKLHKINVDRLRAKVDYSEDGWKCKVSLKGLVENLAFNTEKGSYIKGKNIDANLDINYNTATGRMQFAERPFTIGNNKFLIAGDFSTKKDKIPFKLTIKNNGILWNDALGLLAPNISAKIKEYSLKRPFKLDATIMGELQKRGNPFIVVKADVKDNLLDNPGGPIDKCSFKATFTNNFKEKDGYTDENSAILVNDFSGDYSGIPIKMKGAAVENLINPIAYGDFSSQFDMSNLGKLVDTKLLDFKKGTANVQLDFRAGVENLKLNKPIVSGIITIKDADVEYVPRNLKFNDVKCSLNFTKDDLYITNMSLKGQRSTFNMDGRIRNFLNLYFTNPEQVVLEWQVHSPKLYLDEFMSFTAKKEKHAKPAKKAKKGDFTNDVNTLFSKSSVALKVKIDKMFYKKFYASDAMADVSLTDDGIEVKKASLWHSGGNIAFGGKLDSKDAGSSYRLNTTIRDVNVSRFMETFNNFGMEALKSENLKGLLYTKANISGQITKEGQLVPNTIAGTVDFDLSKASLLNFEPVKDIGKFAFPFRDFDNIAINEMDGKFQIQGDKVTILPMQLSTSVLNLDMEGVYSFGKGTAIYIAVPLRNPKRDKGITDEEKLAERRYRGIVLHLIAADDKDGKVKIKLGKKKD